MHHGVVKLSVPFPGYELLRRHQFHVDYLVRIQILPADRRTVLCKIGITPVPHERRIGIDISKQRDTPRTVPGLFLKFPRYRCFGILSTLNHAAGKLEADVHTAVTKLPDHHQTLVTLRISGDRHNVCPVRGIHDVVLRGPAVGRTPRAFDHRKYVRVIDGSSGHFGPVKVIVPGIIVHTHRYYRITARLDRSARKGKIIRMQSQRIQRLVAELGSGLHEKEELLRLTLLAAIAGQNVFLFGPPGVAKSMVARRISTAFRDARAFEYLLGRFTTPEELFGPVSIARLKDADRFERVTEGFLPDAHIVFLDEIWNASSPILNTLLTAINERRFRNGSEELDLPLRSVIGASRTILPEDTGLENLWDRFLFRLPVHPVTTREAFHNLVAGDDDEYLDPVPHEDKITLDELDEWYDTISTVTIGAEIEDLVFDIRERIARHNSMNGTSGTVPPIVVSDRRWKQAARLLRTSAFLNDRTEVDAIDCMLLRHCLWSREEERETIDTIVAEAIRRYVRSGLFDPEALRDSLREILNAGAGAAPRERRVEQPVSYRGEYYRITDFVDDHLSLIWIGDFQNLREDVSTETDLFFYGDEDEYAYSERFQIRRAGPRSLEIDGVTFDLEHETVVQTDRDRRELSAKEKKALRTQLERFRDEVVSVEDRIYQYRDASTGEAANHLFVHRSFVEVAIRGLDAIASEIAMIKTDVDETLADLA